MSGMGETTQAKLTITVNTDAIMAAFKSLGTTMADACTGIDRFVRALRGLAWRAYHEDGCPHGQHRAGLQRWINENPLWLLRPGRSTGEKPSDS